MKYDCDVIKDLEVLYHEDAISEKSKEVIEEHLKECEQCRRIYEMNSTAYEHNKIQEEEIAHSKEIKKYAGKIKKRRIIITAIVVFIMLIMMSSIISMKTVGVINPFATLGGIVKIKLGSNGIATVQKNPRVIFAKFYSEFKNYIESQGYHMVEEERMGSEYVVEKQGLRERVIIKMNSYATIIQWE
ncbi:Putative zinc-finger [Hathewaya proteolytica DSM 3090]|uniref:Putative zinc-finger n=1 Tax=Hathewaya proteolytica DSM 3090 TaxID=1121331 RepID=A0A1M6RS76_9CLOT|nr:zf-HC2 domain-containing protein [Hathewaya proteolytica]SHK35286.1 Putative zinc-finger [Hathewaya proteolytica DSM 3090]